MPGHLTDVLQIGSNSTRTMRQVSGIRAVGGANGTPLYLHFPQNPGPWEWVFPFTYGFMLPMPQGLTVVEVTSKDTPPGYSPAPTTTLLASLVGLEDPQPPEPGILQATVNLKTAFVNSDIGNNVAATIIGGVAGQTITIFTATAQVTNDTPANQQATNFVDQHNVFVLSFRTSGSVGASQGIAYPGGLQLTPGDPLTVSVGTGGSGMQIGATFTYTQK